MLKMINSSDLGTYDLPVYNLNCLGPWLIAIIEKFVFFGRLCDEGQHSAAPQDTSWCQNSTKQKPLSHGLSVISFAWPKHHMRINIQPESFLLILYPTITNPEVIQKLPFPTLLMLWKLSQVIDLTNTQSIILHWMWQATDFLSGSWITGQKLHKSGHWRRNGC